MVQKETQCWVVASERSLLFHGSSARTKGEASLEGVIFLFPKLKLENVEYYLCGENGKKTPILFRGTAFSVDNGTGKFRGKQNFHG